MVTRDTHPFVSAKLARTLGGALAVVLFAVILLFALLVTLRYAYGWAEVLRDGAAVAAPMAADGLVAIISAAMTGVAVVWLYVRQLAG